MLKSFSTKQLIFLTLIGVILFVADFAISGVIDAAVGVPGSGWIINSIYWFAIAVAGALVVRKFGAVTIIALIYSLLAVPVNLMGPPGFYKLLLGFVVGLSVDIIVILLNYKRFSYYIAAAVANILSIVGLVFLLLLLNLPGADQILKYLWIMIIALAIEAVIGAWLGVKLYSKLKNKRIIRQISS